MQYKKIKVWVLFLSIAVTLSSYAQDELTIEIEDTVELTTTYVKGNKELPQALYIVPWQKIKSKKTTQENMVLHSLYGDVFKPNISIQGIDK